MDVSCGYSRVVFDHDPVAVEIAFERNWEDTKFRIETACKSMADKSVLFIDDLEILRILAVSDDECLSLISWLQSKALSSEVCYDLFICNSEYAFNVSTALQS